MYGGINLVGALLLIFGTMLYLWGLIWLRLFQCCGCCLYKRDAHSRISRKKRAVITTFCNLMFMLMLMIIVILGYFLGSTQLTQSVRTFPESVKGIADIARNEVGYINDFWMNFMSRWAVNTLKDVNGTFTTGVNFFKLYEDLVIINDSLANLPNFDVIGDSITSIDGHIANVSDALDLILLDTDDLDDQKLNVVVQLDVLGNDLIILNESANVIAQAISGALPIVEGIADTQTLLMGEEDERENPEAGLMGSVFSDLQTLEQAATGSFREFPADPSEQLYAPRTTWIDITDGNYSSVTNFLSLTMDCATAASCEEALAELVDLRDYLILCRDNIDNKPDYSVTADNMRLIESETTSIDINSLSVAVASIDNATSSGPDTSEIGLHVQNILDAIDNITLAELEKHIGWVIYEVEIIPEDLYILLGEVQKIPSVLEPLRDPIYDLLYVQPMSINETLFDIETLLKIPENKTFLSHYFLSVNKSITKLLVNFADVEVQILNATEAIFNLNVSTYSQNIREAENAINDQVSAFNATRVLNLINSFGTTMSPNLTSFDSDVGSFGDAINQTNFGDAMYDVLDKLYVANNLSYSQLVTYVGNGTDEDGDLFKLAMGVCSEDTTIYCINDADCSGTCGQHGEYRCVGHGPSPVDLCSADSDCTTTEYCLADYVRMTALYYSLRAFGITDNSTEALEGNRTRQSLSNFETLREGGNFDTQSTIDDLETALRSINTIGIDSYFGEIETTTDGITNIDLSSTVDNINEASDGLDIDFSEFRNATDDAKKLKDDFSDTLLDGFQVIEGAIDFFYNKEVGMQFYLDKLAYDILDNKLSELGSGGMIEYSVHVIDGMQNYWVRLLDGIEDLKNDTFDFANETDDFTRQMDIMSAQKGTIYEDNNKHGSLYYTLMLDPTIGRDVMVSLSEGKNGYITENKDEETYKDDKWCLTSSCFENSADFYESEPFLSSLPAQANLLNIAGLVWVPLAFVFLLSLFTACCPFVCCAKSKKQQYHPATFMLCCMIVIVPWYLIIPGVLFPLVIFASDTCVSYENVGSRTLDKWGDDFCTYVGGEGTIQECVFDVYTDYNISVTVDIDGIYDALMGTCPDDGSDPITDPLYSLSEQLKEESEGAIETETAKDKSPWDIIRPSLKQVVIDSTTLGADIVGDFIEANADHVVDCDSISTIKNNLESPVCTYLVGPVAWYLGMLYLAGWLMCCCGIPNACLIQHHTLWIDFEERVAKVHDEDAAMFGLDDEGNELDEPAFEDEYDENGQHIHRPAKVKYGRVEDDDDNDEDEENARVSLPYVYGKSNIHYHEELSSEDAQTHRQMRGLNKGDYDDRDDGHVELRRHEPVMHDPSYRDEPHHLGHGTAHADNHPTTGGVALHPSKNLNHSHSGREEVDSVDSGAP